jgi:hypothetical protein
MKTKTDEPKQGKGPFAAAPCSASTEWSRELPNDSGWWWIRGLNAHPPLQIVKVQKVISEWCALIWNQWTPVTVYESCEWAGPLIEPSEPNDQRSGPPTTTKMSNNETTTETGKGGSAGASCSALAVSARVVAMGLVLSRETSKPTLIYSWDTVRVLSRVGSHRLCHISRNEGGVTAPLRRVSFHACVPKRWLKVSRDTPNAQVEARRK